MSNQEKWEGLKFAAAFVGLIFGASAGFLLLIGLITIFLSWLEKQI